MPRKIGEVRIKVDDIIGRKVGQLEVVEYAGHWYADTLGGSRMRHKYTCRCECGTIKQVQRGALLNGITRSCGCSKFGARKRGRGYAD